jgi:Domain of unknown function (DUF1844)
MSEQNKPFVVTDRRKFTKDGEPRPDADPSPERERRDEQVESSATLVESKPEASAPHSIHPEPTDTEAPTAPTAEQSDQAKRAYEMTADRLDTAIRSANPGMDHPPTMSFEQLVQSVYMTSIMQLGGTTQEGQQPQVDILGARQSVDMLAVIADKTKGNLNPEEMRLIESALFELRMGFLEVTQALARSAASKAPAAGPSIVR